MFFLRNSNTPGAADITFNYGPAAAGWLPIAGDWKGLSAAPTLAAVLARVAAVGNPLAAAAQQPTVVNGAVAPQTETDLSASSLSTLTTPQYAIADMRVVCRGLAEGNTSYFDGEFRDLGRSIDPLFADDLPFTDLQSAITPGRHEGKRRLASMAPATAVDERNAAPISASSWLRRPCV